VFVSEASSPAAVIRAEPDGYDMAKVQLMGRQAAGNGFLRAAVQARGAGPVYGFMRSQASADGFKAIVQQIDPAAEVEWIHCEHLERLGRVGVLYLADATVAQQSRARQRAGLTSYSLCGVTHTTASHGTMDEIAGLLREPVAPWDALVCTSTSVVETVRRVHEAEADYLRWRFGADARIEGPQLPVIPLGVHCDDFVFDDAKRAAARQALGLAEDEVAALFTGRLVFHAKAHPYAMYRGLQLAAERTGKRLALVLSGWFPNATIEAAFRSGASQFAPDVRLIVVDGRDPTLRTHSWAAADLFVSLSDNIQETFGLTPIEAMAAALPVVVTDYDGYKDTVRHGVDGFCVRTWAPQAGAGQALARGFEVGTLNYDSYCWAGAAATAVDIGQTAEAIATLATDPDLRRRMGQAGRARAREVYDWTVVYRQYQALWAELNARRRAAESDPAYKARVDSLGRAASSRLDPFHIFGHYPTELLTPSTRLTLAPGATRADLNALLDHPLFTGLSLARTQVEAVFGALEPGNATIADIAARLNLNPAQAIRTAALLAKTGTVSNL
jgi:alpha-maltose-1-phosphate synthase